MDHESNRKAKETMDIQKVNWKPVLSLQPAVQHANYYISALVLGKLSQPIHIKFPICCSKEVEILSSEP